MTPTSLSVADILTHLVVTFLTPMFLATGGDLNQARAAAHATVQACTLRSPPDLLLVGQMITLGLATLSSLSQSITEDLSINQVLRLRGNAANLHRRRTLPRRSPRTGHRHRVRQRTGNTMKAAMAHIVAETGRCVREAPQPCPTPPPSKTPTAGMRAAAHGTTASHLISTPAPPRRHQPWPKSPPQSLVRWPHANIRCQHHQNGAQLR